MRKELEDVTQELDGFEDLDPVDQEKVMAAFALGHVREKDMTPCLRENEHEHVEERKEVIDKGDATATSHDHSKDRASKKAGKKRGHPTNEENTSDDNDGASPPAYIEDLPPKRQRRRPQFYDPSRTDLSRRSTKQADMGAHAEGKKYMHSDENATQETAEDQEEEDDDEDGGEEEEEEDSDDSDIFEGDDGDDDDEDNDVESS